MDRIDASPRPRYRRWRNLALGVVGMVALYGLVAGLLLPMLAKKLVAENLGERLGRQVVIDDLAFNPFTLGARVTGFRILEADGRTSFVSFDTLALDGSGTSFYRLAPVVDEVTLTGLAVRLVRDGETHYNLSDILARLAAAPPASKQQAPKDARQPGFSVSNIRVVGARVDFDDQPKKSKHRVSEINIAIPFVSSLPAHLKEFVQPSFSAKVNDSTLKLTGETLPFQDSLTTRLALDLDSLDVRRYLEYSPVPLPVKVESGKLGAKLAVRFTNVPGKDPTADISGSLGLKDLSVSTRDGPLAQLGQLDVVIASFDPIKALLKLDSVRVAQAQAMGDLIQVPAAEARNVNVDLRKKSARVDSLASAGGALSLVRRADGSLELPALPAASNGDTAPSSPWTAALGELALEGYRVTLVDGAVKPAVTHRITLASLAANGITTDKGGSGHAVLRAGLEQGGSLEVDSAFTLEPLVVNAKIDARRVALLPLRPYATQFSTVALKSGAASAKGTLTLRGKGDAMRVAYTGTAEIAGLRTVDTINKEDLLNWNSVRSAGIDFRWAPDAPLTLAVGEIVVDRAYSRVVVYPDGKLNLQQLKTATAAQPDAPVTSGEPRARNVRIDNITFVDSRLNFTDHFIKPNYTADVGELQGSVTNLSSEPESRGVVDLKGSYDKSSPVVIAGTVNPLRGDLFLDVSAKGKDIELPKLTAYSQRYAGYGITQGRLTLDVKYHIEDGKLEGRNNILIDQLTFGDKVDSPEAIKLPLIFAVNLLKDSNGQIALELPITGSLADPQFEIGGLISQVVTSLLKKAVTNPFGLLAAVFGGGGGGGGVNGSASAGARDAASSGDDLAYVDFGPGLMEIGPAETRKLETLVKALQGRPGLTLELASRMDEERELRALRFAALKRKVAEAKRLETGAKGEVAVEEAEYPRFVRAAYAREKLPEKEGMSLAAMETALIERSEIGAEELKALGLRRTERVMGYLVETGKLSAERVVVASAGTAPEDKSPSSRVVFALK